MIKQELFKTGSAADNVIDITRAVVVAEPGKVLPFSVPNRRWQQHSALEKTVLQLGDRPDTDIPDYEKMAVFQRAYNYAMAHDMHKGVFCYRSGIKNIHEMTFEDLFITRSLKSHHSGCFFCRDALKNALCYNVMAYKVRDYLVNYDDQKTQVISVLDPFSLCTMSLSVVKKMFSGAPRYVEFMDLIGNKAC